MWLETVTDEAEVALDRSFGLNLYVVLAHDDLVDLDAIEASGLHLLVQADEWSGDPRADHPAVDGWMVFDEADLTFGPGWDDWSGTDGWNTCRPIQDQGGQCGYTVMQHFNDRVPPGALRYANYGVGVLHFESDEEAEVFINNGFQDVVSADDYAFTNPNTDCRGPQGSVLWLDSGSHSYPRRARRRATAGVGLRRSRTPLHRRHSPDDHCPPDAVGGMAFDHRGCTRDRLLQP